MTYEEIAPFEVAMLTFLSFLTLFFAFYRKLLRDFMFLSFGFLLLTVAKISAMLSSPVIPHLLILSGTALVAYSFLKFYIGHIGELERMERMVFHDPLTGAYSRNFLEEYITEEIKKAKRLDTHFSILLIDLNDFKKVNDTFGHDAGDEVLKIVAQRLRDSLRDYDLIGRWGGDEFLAVLPEETGVKTLEIVDRLVSTFRVAYRGVEVTLSIGYACFPQDGREFEDLLKVADNRMYKSKLLYKEAKKYAVDDTG